MKIIRRVKKMFQDAVSPVDHLAQAKAELQQALTQHLDYLSCLEDYTALTVATGKRIERLRSYIEQNESAGFSRVKPTSEQLETLVQELETK